ncbi:MAG TPA: PRC-barrel domain-containing protein, partial [Opitutaceae bacterium]|nr:PRC-barrel domain-containing protein [Opitutaceae bacterium]
FDDRSWTVRYLVVDTGTWLNSRKVLISPSALGVAEWDKRVLPVALTQDQVRLSPPLDPAEPVTQEHENQLTHYYNWPAYWGPAGFPDMGYAMPMVPVDVEPPQPAGVPVAPARRVSAENAVHPAPHHVRSVRAVTGYAIAAKDGALGHVDDFLIDDRSWEIRYLVVDTRNFLPGKKVIVAPQWIQSVGWEDAKVSVDLARETIKSSPEYDPEQVLTPDYAGQLHDHYGRARYDAW